ncbi:hypothetical protein AXA74_20270 [Bordetella hinzii LMG 13501]|nr:hypothetical protein AXA74_20270 [Bordetella hinzii LMG 13501]
MKLLTKLEELDAYTHVVLRQFPKAERFLLCAEIRGAMNKILRLTIVAWKRRQKAGALFDLDVEVEILRGMVRKAHLVECITLRRRDVWMRHVDEIGRMVGAWIKHEGAAMSP